MGRGNRREEGTGGDIRIGENERETKGMRWKIREKNGKRTMIQQEKRQGK